MPIYEYECRACGQQFEALVRGADQPPCPGCGGCELDRLLSTFAVSSEQTRGQALKDGRQRGAEHRKEKARAQREYEKNHVH